MVRGAGQVLPLEREAVRKVFSHAEGEWGHNTSWGSFIRGA